MKPTPKYAALIGAGLLIGLNGCSTIKSAFDATPVPYQNTQQIASLAVPPDLTTPTLDNHYEVKGNGASNDTTWSAYNASRQAAVASTAAATPTTNNNSRHDNDSVASNILPTRNGVTLERDGNQRWLLIDQPVEQVWPVLVSFWKDNGFTLTQNDQTIGALETNWKDDTNKLPQDFVHSTLGKILPSLYNSNQRDQFHTHVERDATHPDQTDVYLSERVVTQVYDNSIDGLHTQWQTMPADPATEAEMLASIMQHFGVDKPSAQAMLATPHATSGLAHLGKTADGAATLTDAEPFDRAWLRVGMALDQVGYNVIAKDKTKGIYTVTEDRTAVNDKSASGFWSKLAFWNWFGNNFTQYQIELDENAAATSTDIHVLNDAGKPAPVDVANRIVQKLYNQLQ